MEKSSEIKPNIKQEQIHDLLFNREIGWQEIIYDLINTEQLDPWDIDIVILTDKFFQKIEELEELDFFVSSKVLLAASLLVRIKSEILLSRQIKSIDEILFGGKEQKKQEIEKFEFDEDIPELIPRTPVPRFRKVTLQELMDSLNKAISTENRRIKKEIVNKNALREAGILMPKRKFSIGNRLKSLQQAIASYFKSNNNKKVPFTELVGKEREKKLLSFFPLLQLENNKEIWLEQNSHFEEIFVWLSEVYFKDNPDPYIDLKKQLEQEYEEELKKEEIKQQKKESKNLKT